MNPALKALQHHVTGAIERGEAVAITEQRAPESIQCPRCYGRGYKPEARRSGRGFYARTCPRCGGAGQVAA